MQTNAVRKPEGQITDSMALSGSQVQLKLPLWTALVDVADFGNSKLSRVFTRGERAAATHGKTSPHMLEHGNYHAKTRRKRSRVGSHS